MDGEECDWSVGSSLGNRIRVCFDNPSGAHPFTPESIRQRYVAEIRNSALVVWHLHEAGIGGVRAGIDEVAWQDADIANFEVSFSRPSKGSGYVWLTAQRHSGQQLAVLFSDRYDDAIDAWFRVAVALLDRVYPGLVRIRDDGCDA